MSLFTAYESITVSTTAVSLTAATYDGARAAFITVEDAAIRFRVDGTNPTASEGHTRRPGGVIRLYSANELKNFRAIRKDGADAVLKVSYAADVITEAPVDDVAAVAQGEVAAGSTDSGYPVKVGGKYNASLPTLTDGQRGDAQLDIRSLLMTAPNMILSAGANTRALLSTMLNVSVDASSGGSLLATGGALYNGSSYDRIRNNAAATGLASGARTASTQTPDQTNYNGKGVQVTLDVTATPNNAETLQVTVEAKDPVSGKYVQIAAFTALVASALGATPTTETYVYTLYPGAAETIAAAKHELQSLPVGRTWRVNVLHSAGGSWTYSVGVTNLV